MDSGHANFAPSFGTGRYDAYVCVDFKGDAYDLGAPTQYGAWDGDTPTLNATDFSSFNLGSGAEAGALLTFAPSNASDTTILARVGVSFISQSQACANAESEIPDFDFAGVQSAAQAQWKELLGRVQVDTDGVDGEIVELFYSSVSRANRMRSEESR